MADRFDRATRSKIMSTVRSKGTKQELEVRRALHAAGFRYRLHGKELPGHPDIVLPRFKYAIFVHGCFWHGHVCPRGHLPASNCEFWRSKIERNIERDTAARAELKRLGWHVHVIWACELQHSVMHLIGRLREMDRCND